VQEAFSARTAVDGVPPSAHDYETATIVKPDDTLWGIATSHKDLLSAEEADNAQITDPNSVGPGQVVFSPGQSPVSARTTADIEAAEHVGTPQRWTTVEHDIANDLRSQAGGKLLPDRVVRPTVQALDQWAVGSGNLRQVTQTAYDQVCKGWQERGITGQQLAPLLTNRQAAVQDEEALTHLRPPVNHLLVAGEEQQAGQAWSKMLDRELGYVNGAFKLGGNKSLKVIGRIIGNWLGEVYPRIVHQGVYRAKSADSCFRHSCSSSGFAYISVHQGELRRRR
jgi:hypothetical protein